jgi:hypothetical protein
MTVSRELSIYKMDLGEIGWVGVNKICLTQDGDTWRDLVNAVMNLGVLYNATKLSSGYTSGGLSRTAQLHRFG